MPEMSHLQRTHELYDCSICLDYISQTRSRTSQYDPSELEQGGNDLKEFWQKYGPPGMEDMIEKAFEEAPEGFGAVDVNNPVDLDKEADVSLVFAQISVPAWRYLQERFGTHIRLKSPMP
jgi:hypothetical protein